jgi:hypothetical protein
MKLLWRVVVAIVYVAAALLLSVLKGNGPPGPGTDNAQWFFILLAYQLLANIANPYFETPRDTLVNCVAVGLGVITLPGQVPDAFVVVVRSFGAGVLSAAGGGAVMAIVSIGLFQARPGSISSRTLYRVTTGLFRYDVLYLLLFALSVLPIAFTDFRYALGVVFLWIVMQVGRPVEGVVQVLLDLAEKSSRGDFQPVGRVRLFRNPGICLIVADAYSDFSPGQQIVVCDSRPVGSRAVIISTAQLSGEYWYYALIEPGGRKVPVPKKHANAALAHANDDQTNLPALDDLVGFVVEASHLHAIVFHLLPHQPDVTEGSVVTVVVRGQSVLYQVVGAVNRYETLEDQSVFGYTEVTARKLGRWDGNEARFRITSWLPTMYTPVRLWTGTPDVAPVKSIGVVPHTTFHVSTDPHTLVTHNTAILGILGSGKSFLAFELIARIVNAGIKVLCFDITGQYCDYLSDLYRDDADLASDQSLNSVAKKYNANVNKSVEKGGSVLQFTDAVKQSVVEFLSSDRPIRIVNPEAFDVWRQDSRPFQDAASMASLSPVEITTIFVEALHRSVSDQMSEKARVCVVFEEAHSLLPEFHSISQEGEKTATMRTAKAILQGRKYGMGSIVITQRTANVTKTVLNQCNNLFALRTFDSTGIEFLSNYIGRDYADVLSTLEERHAVVYGNAVSSDSPLIVRLNDRDTFEKSLRSVIDRDAIASSYVVPK